MAYLIAIDPPVCLFDAVHARNRAALDGRYSAIETVKAGSYVYHEGRACYVIDAFSQPDDGAGTVALLLDTGVDGGEFLTVGYGSKIETAP